MWDAELRDQLAAAYAQGISHKRFLGWEPTTTYTYDHAGRMISSAPEVEWDDQERAKRLAWDVYQSEICACGLHISVADTDPDAGTKARICPVCAGIAVAHRRQSAADDQAVKALGQNPPPEAPRPTDGRYISVEMRQPKPSSPPG